MVHPLVEPLAFLLGTWQGRGRGEYPTIEPFEYVETVWFEPAPPTKPFISYRQATRRLLADGQLGEPLHAEAGYVRALEDGGLELVIAQPTGILEGHHGTRDGQRLTFGPGRVMGTATATEVTSVRREVEVDGDTLTYDLAMAAVGQPLTHHLAAELRRIE